jgi:CspA family cold shock protein
MDGVTITGAGMKAEGTVKMFDDGKGYGFIAREVGKDVFVNRNAILGMGLRHLAVGDRVQFEIEEGSRGPRASNVRRLALGTVAE